MMIKKYLGAALIASALIVSACNTVSGAGEDLQSASETGKDVIN